MIEFENVSKDKLIDEMASAMCDDCRAHTLSCERIICDSVIEAATAVFNAGYRKQSEGEWEWFEEWSPSTPEHPRECDDCGWRCGKCKVALEDMVGGYWDNAFEKPKLNYCPNCGARMRKEDEGK